MNTLKTILLTGALAMTTVQATAHANPVFNIFELGVQADKAAAYDELSKATVSQSIASEPGTLAMYSVKNAENPELAYMIEVYADDAAYQKHLASPQYKAFIEQSPDVLTAHKERIELTPVYLGDKAAPIRLDENTIANFGHVTVNGKDAKAYRQIVLTEMVASVKNEPGVLAIYAGTMKSRPETWYFFEIYKSAEAVAQHREAPHFKSYLEDAKGMLADRAFSKVTPITLMNQGKLNFIDIKIAEETMKQADGQQLLAGHRQWFSKYVEQGNFLLLGPYKDIPFAGLIIAQAESREALDAILKEDAFYPDKAAYEIHEFSANKIHPQITDFISK